MNLPIVESLLKIGEVASNSGLSIKTVRYYEEIGLLSPTVVRSHTGYRLFSPRVVERLAFIKRAQALGLSLNEISEILRVHDQGQLPCGEVKHHLEEKVAAISQQIAALETLRSELQNLLSGWQEHPPREQALDRICPNIQSHHLKLEKP